MATVSNNSSTLFLYDHPVSSYAQKVRIALREKGIPFTSQVPDAIRTGKAEKEFEAANPRLEVPALIDSDAEIFDSTVILEYIEDKWPEPALLPPRSGPAARARARMIEDICDTHYEAINWGWGEVVWFKRAEGALAESMTREAARQTDVIMAWLTEKLGSADYFGGNEYGFGWADVSAAPFVNRSKYYGLGPKDESPLGRWLARISERPSVKETFAEFADAAGKIPAMGPMFLRGERQREYRDHRLEWMMKSGGSTVVLDGMKNNNIRFTWP